MSQRILIVTELGDLHALAAAEVLQQRGAEPTLWLTSDYPMVLRESVLFEKGAESIRLQGPGLDVSEPRFDTVWNRRPRYVIDPERLHPADVGFADMGVKAFREALFDTLCPEAFWVNPREAATLASRKLYQHHVARGVGLAMPDTLYTNDPELIRAFIRRHGGRIAFKPLKSLSWRDEQTYYTPYTRMITEEQLVEDDLLMLAPSIYQAEVPKAYELRVTVIGRHVFPARIHSQQTQRGKEDWRKAYGELQMSETELPEHVSKLCLALLERLGLVYGAFDFIVTPEGEHVFLEVNQMGQFLFVERLCGVPLLDAFCELLIQGRPDFSWSRERATARYDEAMSLRLREQAENPPPGHVKPPLRDTYWYEGDPGRRPKE
jgi:hypothetical protein